MINGGDLISEQPIIEMNDGSTDAPQTRIEEMQLFGAVAHKGSQLVENC